MKSGVGDLCIRPLCSELPKEPSRCLNRDRETEGGGVGAETCAWNETDVGTGAGAGVLIGDTGDTGVTGVIGKVR